MAHVLIAVYSPPPATPPSTLQPSGCRTQVGQAFLGTNRKASGAFHLLLDKGCSRCAVQGSGLTAPCAVGLRFAFTRRRRVWEALPGSKAAWACQTAQGSSAVGLRPAPPAPAERPGSLRRLATCQLFSNALRCGFSSPILRSKGDKLFFIHCFSPFFFLSAMEF